MSIARTNANEYIQIFDEDIITRFIENQISRNNEIPESRIRSCIKRSLQCLAFPLGVVANLPFIPISLKLAGNNRPYGIALACGNELAFSSFISWSFLNIVNEELRAKTNEEQELEEKNIKIKDIIIKTAIIGIGLISQVPTGYMAYTYNNNSISNMMIMVTCNCISPIYSMWMTRNLFRTKNCFSEIEKQLKNAQKSFCQLFDNRIEEILSLTPEDRETLFNRMPFNDSSEVFLKNTQSFQKPHQNSNTINKIGRCITALTGIGLSIAQLTVTSMLGYNAGNLLFNDEASAYATSTFVTLCNAYLKTEVVFNSTMKIYQSAVNFFNKKRSLPSQIQPKLSTALRIGALAIAGLSYGPAVMAARDNFTGILQKALEISFPMGTLALTLNAMNDLIDDSINACSRRFGCQSTQNLLQHLNDIQKIKHFISQCPTEKFANFLWQLPEELRSKLLIKLNITTEQITYFLEGNRSNYVAIN